jgi:hypothetical protein
VVVLVELLVLQHLYGTVGEPDGENLSDRTAEERANITGSASETVVRIEPTARVCGVIDWGTGLGIVSAPLKGSEQDTFSS